MQYRRSVQGGILLTELETSARTESKRMTNHNTPKLSRMGLPVHCATFPGLSRLNTRAVPNTNRINTNTNMHALSGIRIHDHRVRASEVSSCLRPRGHRDRHQSHMTTKFVSLAERNELGQQTRCPFL
jgi:hypothetical protein